MIRLADLKTQHNLLKAEISTALEQTITGGRFIGGEPVTLFEEAFANYVGTSNCVGCGNGTDALELAITALDLPLGSEILVQANSFIASAEAIVNCGHVPVFLDIQHCDYSIDLAMVSELINDKTKAIIVVHLYGCPANMDAVQQLVQQFDLRLIEDCAQAHGATWRGKSIGSFGDLSCFSFFPGKNLGALGDAGAICTSDESLAKMCKMLSNHGRLDKFGHRIVGRNSRMDTLHAAVLSVKLKHIKKWSEQRCIIAKQFDMHLDSITDKSGRIKPTELATCVYHQYIIRSEYRDSVQAMFTELGIETGVHYPKAINEYYPFAKYKGDTPKAKAVSNEILSIPVHQHLRNKDVDLIKEGLTKAFC